MSDTFYAQSLQLFSNGSVSVQADERNSSMNKDRKKEFDSFFKLQVISKAGFETLIELIHNEIHPKGQMS
ncbi:MAG: hypothetical protein LBP34_00025 [Flavobacteriaceae bacterium]|jgi:hypothetical protein|nr:hypothetical protein [Flavobacteriaceae bacterium]